MTMDKIIFYRESLAQSVWADIVSFVMIVAVLGVNHFVMGDNKITYFIWITLFFVSVSVRSNTKRMIFTDKEKLIEYVNSL